MSLLNIPFPFCGEKRDRGLKEGHFFITVLTGQGQALFPRPFP
jgi:hypothetical protein